GEFRQYCTSRFSPACCHALTKSECPVSLLFIADSVTPGLPVIGYWITTVSAGTATGCEAGQRPASEYAMWLLWSALSVCCPSQQFGKCTWTRRLFAEASGHVGIATDGDTSSFEQFQNTTCVLCGDVACELPAT